ncbi:MAG: DNA polymerase IV [Spirochaetes bacterium]|nr:DNA polymerase IV [Spirochaetota bacterium]
MYFHIDLDAFFASVEQNDHPELKGKPVVVGAQHGQRGVVSTCSYEARRYGIHSAMPINEAYRRCPQAFFLPVRMNRYIEISDTIIKLFGDFTPDVHQVSIDEASLDMTGTERLWGPPEKAALLIKAAVASASGLSVSIGVAANRYIAKIACGLKKPDGLVLVPPGSEEAFMRSLALRDIWGAGEKTRERFAELGIKSVSNLADYNLNLLQSLFGRAGGEFLFTVCRGQDPGIYTQEARSKSIGTETTFGNDVIDSETISAVLLQICQELSQRLYRENYSANGLQLKLRYEDFSTLTTRSSRPAAFTCMDEIYAQAMKLFNQKWNGRPIRLIGLSLFGFNVDVSQPELFTTRESRAGQLEKAVFEVNRSGLGTLTRARLLKQPTKPENSEPNPEKLL